MSGFMRRKTLHSHWLPLLILFLWLALSVELGFASNQQFGLPPKAHEVTGKIQMYDEVEPVCSPDGRWLAFEYHEANGPNYPHVGIMNLSQDSDSSTWIPLLKEEPGQHLYAGDFSWSPDSRWLALITDYPKGSQGIWAESNLQIVKVNIKTHEVIRITHFPPNTYFGPTTTWLQSGMIIFAGDDQNIYGISDKGGAVQKLINVPTDKCGGVTNTLAASPDGQTIAFVMESNSDDQIEECNALWVADIRTGNLRRVSTIGVHPLSPFWLDGKTILFSGINIEGGKWTPVGIYSISLKTKKMVHLLNGPYLTPFVGDFGRTLYFSWGANLQTKMPHGNNWSSFIDFSGFHIWKMPVQTLQRQHSK